MWRWPLGRLIIQLAMMLFLFVVCTGALGVEGSIGAIAVIGVVVMGYAIVRAVRKR